MSRIHRPGNKATMLVGALAVALLFLLVVTYLVVGRSSTTSLTPAAMVLDPSYAKSIGFAKTLQAAKKTRVTTQKGCSDSVRSLYEDASATMGLLAQVLNCNSKESAAAALATARQQVSVDKAVKIPKELGKNAFATAYLAPEYLIAWQEGTRLVFTAIDVDVKASSSTTGQTSKPLTTSQRRTLVEAAVQQNSLLD